MPKFRPGERARIRVDARSDYPALHGSECVVIQFVDHWPQFSDWPWYEIDVPGFPSPSGCWYVVEIILEKLLPPDWGLTTWDQCLWRPKVKIVEPSVAALNLHLIKKMTKLQPWQEEILRRFEMMNRVGLRYYEFPRNVGKRWRP